MYDIQKKPCRRCLLEQAGEYDIAKAVSERISLIPPDKKAADEIYSQRLAICRECESLVNGTCLKCGCYVELRAARADNYCPHEKKFWKAET